MSLMALGMSIGISIDVRVVGTERSFEEQRESVEMGLLAAQKLQTWFRDHLSTLNACHAQLIR